MGQIRFCFFFNYYFLLLWPAKWRCPPIPRVLPSCTYQSQAILWCRLCSDAVAKPRIQYFFGFILPSVVYKKKTKKKTGKNSLCGENLNGSVFRCGSSITITVPWSLFPSSPLFRKAGSVCPAHHRGQLCLCTPPAPSVSISNEVLRFYKWKMTRASPPPEGCSVFF